MPGPHRGPEDRGMTPRFLARSAVLAGLVAALAVSATSLASPARADEVVPLPGRFTVTDRPVHVTVNPGALVAAVADCREGEQLVGGGYSHLTPAYRGDLEPVDHPLLYTVVADRPSDDGSTWLVRLANRTPTPILVTVHAECASTPVTTTVVARPGVADGTDEVRALCPDGTVATAGGWDLPRGARPDARFVVQRSMPFRSGQTDGWSLVSAFGGSPGEQVTSYALCAGDDVQRGAQHPVQVTAPPAGETQVTSATEAAPCGGGDALTSGAFALDEPRVTAVPDLDPVSVDGVPLRWRLTIAVLPHRTGYPTNPGAGATLLPVCVRIPPR